MSRVRALLRGVMSLAALSVLVGGVPWALTRWGPLPSTASGEGWGRLSDTVVSDHTVFAVLTVAVWAVWAIFMTSVLVEVIAGVRGVQAPRLGFAGPLQRAAAALVVGVLVAVSLFRPAPAFAASRTTAPAKLPSRDGAVTVVVELPAAPAPPYPTGDTMGGVASADPPATASPPAAGGVITVELHDSPWKLAEIHLHDGLRWRELWELNRNVVQPDGRSWTDPQLILPGWQLRLPGADPTTQAPPAASSADPVAVHAVERGDTLSEIAEKELGDPDRYREVFAANIDIVQRDGRRLTDPNVILPGWHLTIPTHPPAAIAPPPPGTQTSAPPRDIRVPAIAEQPPTVPSTPDPTATPTTTPAPSTFVPVSSTPLPTTSTPPRPFSTTEAPERPPDTERSPVPIMAGISGAVALATGIALRMRWLRQRRATRGARHGSLPTSPVELAALTAADVPLVRWAGQHLACLVRDLDRRRVTAGPVAVELSTETGVEVLWDGPQHAPTPDGWTAADGGWAWRLGYDPDDPVPGDELPAGIPALVTIGQRDGRQLLVDLEAFGLLTVTGPDEHTDAFVRSITVELACGNDLADAYVTAVNVDVGLDRHERLTVTDAVTATAQLQGTQRSIADVLEHAGTNDSFTARASDSTPIEATVIIARADGEHLARLGEVVGARRGVAAVVAVDRAVTPTDGHAHIQIDRSGTSARLDPLGITFDPVGLPAPTAEAVHAALTTLAELPDDLATEAEETPAFGAAGRPGHRPAAPEGSPTAVVDVIADPPARTVGNGSGGNGAHADRAVLAPVEEDRADPAEDDFPSTATLEWPGSPDGRLFEVEALPVDDSARLLIRVLGVPGVPARPSIGRRELILAALLACRGGTLAASAAQDALWGGKPLEVKTAWNLYASTRRALGSFDDGTPVMPSTDRARGLLRLDPRVTTDLAVLRGILEQAGQASSVEAAALLQEGLGLVEGPPFDAPGYDWAHRDQDVSSASTVIEQAVDLLVELAVGADQLDVAREAIIRGLRGLPGDEHLYRRRMSVESHAGNHAGIVAAYDELTVYLADFETSPSAASTALYHELIHAPRPSPGPLR